MRNVIYIGRRPTTTTFVVISHNPKTHTTCTLEGPQQLILSRYLDNMAIQMGNVECGGVTVLHMPCQALFKGAAAGWYIR